MKRIFMCLALSVCVLACSACGASETQAGQVSSQISSAVSEAGSEPEPVLSSAPESAAVSDVLSSEAEASQLTSRAAKPVVEYKTVYKPVRELYLGLMNDHLDSQLYQLEGTYEYMRNGECWRRAKSGWIDEYDYDENGGEIAHRRYDLDGNLKDQWESTCDEYGNQLTLSHYVGESFDYRWEYTYDRAGRKTSESYFSRNYEKYGLPFSKTEFTYDEDGKTLKEEHYEIDFRLNKDLSKTPVMENDYSYEYTYDENGNLLRQDEYSDSQLQEQYLYEYDGEGRLTRRTLYSVKSDSTTFVEVYRYNETGEHVATDTVRSRVDHGDTVSTISREAYEHDSNGRMVKNISYDKVPMNEDGSGDFSEEDISSVDTWTYDADGHMLTYRTDYPESGRSDVFEYTYDSNGNRKTADYYKNNRYAINLRNIREYEYKAFQKPVMAE